MAIYRAEYCSEHFDFEAYGLSQDEAIVALKRGLEEHAKRKGLPFDWWNERYEGVPMDEIFFLRLFEIGMCYRDGEILA